MTQVATPTAAAPTRPLYAADLLEEEHPLHNWFISWVGSNPPTKRKARAFLRDPKVVAFLTPREG